LFVLGKMKCYQLQMLCWTSTGSPLTIQFEHLRLEYLYMDRRLRLRSCKFLMICNKEFSPQSLALFVETTFNCRGIWQKLSKHQQKNHGHLSSFHQQPRAAADVYAWKKIYLVQWTGQYGDGQIGLLSPQLWMAWHFSKLQRHLATQFPRNSSWWSQLQKVLVLNFSIWFFSCLFLLIPES
jgi:hypothetical protein